MYKLFNIQEVAELRLVNDPKSVNDVNSIYVRMVGSALVLNTLPEKFSQGNYCKVTPIVEIEKDYLLLILKEPLEWLFEESKGAVKKISMVQLKGIVIPIPSMEEQRKVLGSKDVLKRIAEIHDEYSIPENDPPVKINMSFQDAIKKIMKGNKD